MTTKTIDPVEQLTRLEAARDTCRLAEEEAREQQLRLQRAVPLARERLQSAHATGDGIPAAEKAFTAAQVAADDPAHGARAAGLAQRTRAADAAVQQHLAANFSELVETMRPRAKEVVAAVAERAAELRAAIDEWNRVSVEVGALGRGSQWFVPWQQIPADPFDKLGAALDQLGEIPLPMPRSTVHPAEQAERERVAAEGQVAA